MTDFPVKKCPDPRIVYGNERDAPGASLTDGKQTTHLLLTDSETGNALEKQDGNPSEHERPDCSFETIFPHIGYREREIKKRKYKIGCLARSLSNLDPIF